MSGIQNDIVLGVADSTNGNSYSDYRITSAGVRTGGAIELYGTYDARLRPWYVLGATSAGVNFGEVYQVRVTSDWLLLTGCKRLVLASQTGWMLNTRVTSY